MSSAYLQRLSRQLVEDVESRPIPSLQLQLMIETDPNPKQILAQLSDQLSQDLGDWVISLGRLFRVLQFQLNPAFDEVLDFRTGQRLSIYIYAGLPGRMQALLATGTPQTLSCRHLYMLRAMEAAVHTSQLALVDQLWAFSVADGYEKILRNYVAMLMTQIKDDARLEAMYRHLISNLGIRPLEIGYPY